MGKYPKIRMIMCYAKHTAGFVQIPKSWLKRYSVILRHESNVNLSSLNKGVVIDSDFTEIKITDDYIFGRLNTK